MQVKAPLGEPVAVLLGRHPKVGSVLPGGPAIEFDGRRLSQGEELPLSGLLELEDCNPVMCAEAFSIPSPLSTLALIALGPLVQGGLVAGPVALHAAVVLDPGDLLFHLEKTGLDQEVTLAMSDEGFGRTAVLNAYVPIPLLDDCQDIDRLFEEKYERSPFVKMAGDEEWDVKLVQGTPFAACDLRLTQGEEQSLLTVRVMADLEGSLGACRLIHAFNVMNGFEEHLGVPPILD